MKVLCYSCGLAFPASAWYIQKIVTEQIPDEEIRCDTCSCDYEEEFNYDDQVKVFWEEVWS